MKLKCDNWMCDSYGITIEFNTVTMKIKNERVFYYLKTGELIVCEECKEPLIEQKGEFKGFCTSFSSFNSKTPEEKRKILKKRERNLNKIKCKEGVERKKAHENGEI